MLLLPHHFRSWTQHPFLVTCPALCQPQGTLPTMRRHLGLRQVPEEEAVTSPGVAGQPPYPELTCQAQEAQALGPLLEGRQEVLQAGTANLGVGRQVQ